MLTGGAPTLDEVWYDPVEPIPEQVQVLQIERDEALLYGPHPAQHVAVGQLAEAFGRVRELAVSAGLNQAAVAARNGAFADASVQRREGFAAYLDEAGSRRPMAPGVALDVLAKALPDDVVVVDESITAGPMVEQAFALRGPADYFAGRGGGIGQGIAGALGVAAAQRGRKVLALSGDGSAMYSVQAFWTAAHHKLDVLFVILANREYRILKHNVDIHRRRFNDLSDQPYPHMDLTNPLLGFADLARGMGVPGAVCEDPSELLDAVHAALETSGPYLIEAVVEGKET